MKFAILRIGLSDWLLALLLSASGVRTLWLLSRVASWYDFALLAVTLPYVVWLFLSQSRRPA